MNKILYYKIILKKFPIKCKQCKESKHSILLKLCCDY